MQFAGFLPHFPSFSDSSDSFNTAMHELFPSDTLEVLYRDNLDDGTSTKVPIYISSRQHSSPLHIPSFHCMGKSDQQIPVEASQVLADFFIDPYIVVHEGGHFIPSSIKKEYRDFLAKI
ncbi:hypothetical protein GEMRC1_002381 [Eukaryota sp. GEM-RC1]